MLMGSAAAPTPAPATKQASLETVTEAGPLAAASSPPPSASPLTAASPTRPSSHSVSLPITSTATASAPLKPIDPDDIVVDSERARGIATRSERKEHAPLYVGGSTTSAPPLPTRPAALSTPAKLSSAANPTTPAAASSAASPASAAAAAQRRASTFKASNLPCRARDWNPSTALSKECLDDWDAHGRIPGEKAVMQIPDVVSYNAHDELPAVVHALYGTLFMTSYQLFLEPTQKRDRLGPAVQAIPLSTIDRIEIEKSRGGGSVSGSPLGPHHLLNYLDIYSKDGRFIKFGFMKFDECKRAYDCLNQYVFPAKEEYLFAFYYRLKTPIPAHLDGWNLYDPIEEFKRQGVNTIPLSAPHSTQSEDLRLSWANESFTLCSSYPRVFVVPSEKYVTDIDLHLVAQFRSRGRIPVCTWKHPTGRQTIWRCSQPKVGMNNTRCAEDEKLLSSITNFSAYGEMFGIFDARPKFNARANILAGKGFENPDLYRNCLKKIFFQNIENIHVMRQSYQALVKACQKEVHDQGFLMAVTQSGWLNHISIVLKATVEMVKALDQDKISLLIHCSDGWDRTAQLAGLCELCLDPFYRTTRGFFILIEKEWISYGHQFQRRTGHKDKNWNDDQRSCIFLQWCDTVYQLLLQFPRHFEFNSHLLVTLVHHLYSCRFGTFFYNSDMVRRKNKIREKTVSLWTYFMCSPAAIRGEFTNQLYSRQGNGQPEAIPGGGAAGGGEEEGKSSVGRGGGDGSSTSIGSVLYPSYSLKKIALWSDYFLRFSNEQLEQISVTSAAAGSVPPFQPVTSRMQGNEAALQQEIRRVQKENHVVSGMTHANGLRAVEFYCLVGFVISLSSFTQLSSAFGHHSNRIRDLEAELFALKLKYGHVDVPAESASSDSASASSETAVASVPNSPAASAAVNGVVPLSVDDDLAAAPAAASTPTDNEGVDEETRAAELAALAELRQRLQKDVDANISIVEHEEAEDPTTL
jgi:myotubularin-related protein 1/2